MLKWLTGQSGTPPAAGALLTDDPLATIAGRDPRKHQPVYGVTRVNPLFREGPTESSVADEALSSSEPSSAGSERDTERHSLEDHLHTHRIPPDPAHTPADALRMAATSDETRSDRDRTTQLAPTEQYWAPQSSADPPNVNSSSVSKANADPGVKHSVLVIKPGSPRSQRQAHGRAGFDVLVMNRTFVTSISVNLAHNVQQNDTKFNVFKEGVSPCIRPNTSERHLAPLSKHLRSVRNVQLTPSELAQTVCPRLVVTKHSDFVVSISAPCAHKKNLAPSSLRGSAPRRSGTCPEVRVDVNANYIVSISTSCSHVKLEPSDSAADRLQQPSFHLDPTSSYDIITPSSATGLDPPSGQPAPDSLVTDSLLALTASSYSPNATLYSSPSSSSTIYEDRRTPERVLRELSHIISNSRSVAAVRRVGSDVRSSSASSSVTSQLSRASSSASGLRRQLTAPDAATLWQRTGLLTNGRKLVGSEEEEEAPQQRALVGAAGGRRLTPSPPVPARLPVTGGWLQRLTEVPVRSEAPDPDRLTDVVVEPGGSAADRLQPGWNGSAARHVTFAFSHPQIEGAAAAPAIADPLSGNALGSVTSSPSAVTSQWLTAPGRDQQGLWNSYYGGTLAGYGPLQPTPAALKENQKAIALNDRKFSAFTLDVTGASRLLQRAVENKRSRRLCRIVIVTLVLAALLGSVVIVSWICSKGRHLFGAL